MTALAVAIARGGFEYQGQKCSAASRVYLPKSLAPRVLEDVAAMARAMKLGDPADFSCFLGAVIGRSAFERLSGYLERARRDANCRVLAGGGVDASVGYFVEPTLVEVKAPDHELFQDELFGPIVSVLVYDDARYTEAVALCEAGSPYALTGAVFAEDEAAIAELSRALRFAAGNFYVNDKPTGAVVGQQPFGGSRRSGTNDKAGSPFNLLRWVSPRIVKRNFAPPRDFRYPHQLPD